MKIKHFAGYGTVKATKVESKKFTDKLDGIKKKTLVIRVEGNHEWGLVRYDICPIFNWLVRRFDKTVKDYTQILSININDTVEEIDNVATDVCIYTILIKDAA